MYFSESCVYTNWWPKTNNVDFMLPEPKKICKKRELKIKAPLPPPKKKRIRKISHEAIAEYPKAEIVHDQLKFLLDKYRLRNKSQHKPNSTLEAISKIRNNKLLDEIKTAIQSESLIELKLCLKSSKCECCLFTSVTKNVKCTSIDCNRCAYCHRCYHVLKQLSRNNKGIYCITKIRGITANGSKTNCALRLDQTN
jgi:hypothetical protein